MLRRAWTGTVSEIGSSLRVASLRCPSCTAQRSASSVSLMTGPTVVLWMTATTWWRPAPSSAESTSGKVSNGGFAFVVVKFGCTPSWRGPVPGDSQLREATRRRGGWPFSTPHGTVVDYNRASRQRMWLFFATKDEDDDPSSTSHDVVAVNEGPFRICAHGRSAELVQETPSNLHARVARTEISSLWYEPTCFKVARSLHRALWHLFFLNVAKDSPNRERAEAQCSPLVCRELTGRVMFAKVTSWNFRKCKVCFPRCAETDCDMVHR